MTRLPVLAGLLILVGCASGANRCRLAPDETTQITVDDSSLQERVEIVSGRAVKGAGGLEVLVRLLNVEDSEQEVELRWTWETPEGERIGAPVWEPRTFAAKADEEIRVTGPPGAGRVIFELRGPEGS